MEVYDIDKVKIARRLRKRGLSFEKIGNKLSVSEGTIRTWCFDIPSNNEFFLSALNSRKQIRNSEKKVLKNLVLDKNSAKIFASLLYWAEGTKYPYSAAISFSNSDPGMVVTFLRLLRLAFLVDENKFKVHLQLHTTHNRQKIFHYWSQLLKIPLNQFWKPTVTLPTRKMKRRDYLGTCTIRYHDYRLLLKLMGIYEEFGERSHSLA